MTTEKNTSTNKQESIGLFLVKEKKNNYTSLTLH